MWTKQHSRGGSWPPCILCEGGDEHADDEHGDDEHGDDEHGDDDDGGGNDDFQFLVNKC